MNNEKNISCEIYNKLNKTDKEDYGYVQLEYLDANKTRKDITYPFDCKEFKRWTYMHINPMLSDYIRRHNKEFKEFEQASLNYDYSDLKILELTFLKDI